MVDKSEINSINKKIFSSYSSEKMINEIHGKSNCLYGIMNGDYRNYDYDKMIQNIASDVYDENKGKWKFQELQEIFNNESKKHNIQFSKKMLKHFVLHKWEVNSPDFGINSFSQNKYDLRLTPIQNAKKCIKTYFEDLALDTFDDIGGTELYIDDYFNITKKKGKYFPILKKLL